MASAAEIRRYRWERVLRAPSAAAYAGYRGETAFRRAVAAGEMPLPFKHDGKDAWDIQEIDAAIEALKIGAKKPGRSWLDLVPDRV